MRRRHFIKTSVAAGVVSSTFGNLFDPLSVRAYANGPLFARLAHAAGTGRVLVIIQLDGGNDGLNTVIPHQDPLYNQYRGTLAITNPIRITDTLGWHPIMTPFDTMYQNGEIAIVQDVGYPNSNRSHFRSTDVMFSASNNNSPPDQNTFIYNGWVGRYMDLLYPDYPDTSPVHPMALQIGNTTGLLLEGSKYPMGMAVNDPISFYNIISGTDVSGSEKPDLGTPAGLELDYIQRVSAEAMAYALPVRDAFNSVTNRATYTPGVVSDRLKIIARLIAGGLETPVYVISQGGYDTHTQQATRHQNLLQELTRGVSTFFDDLKQLGVADRVALMTITEFGRRVGANGDAGTDHGTASPMFFVGPKVYGGLFGKEQDLANLDRLNDLKHQFDFRQTYASVLRQWFGVNPSNAAAILKGEFETLALFDPAPVGVNGTSGPADFALHQNFPNPVAITSTTQIPFTTPGGRTSVRVYNMLGREVATLTDHDYAPGKHNVTFNPSHLSSGTYIYRLESRGRVESRTMVVTK